MADKKGGMASFARRNEQSTPVFDDLKATVPNPAYSKPLHIAKQQFSTSAQPRSANRSLQPHRMTAFGQASSIGATSTTPDEAYAQPTYHAQPNAGHQSSLEQEDLFDEIDDDVMITEERQVQKTAVAPAQAQTQGLPRNTHRQPFNGQQYGTGISSKAVKGDSYPPTTSGLPSISDDQERRDEQDNAGPQAACVQPPRAPFQVTLPKQRQQQAAGTIVPPKNEKQAQVVSAAARVQPENPPPTKSVVLVPQTSPERVKEPHLSQPVQIPETVVKKRPHPHSVITPPATMQQRGQRVFTDPEEPPDPEPSSSQTEESKLDYEVDDLMQMDFGQLQGEMFDRQTEADKAKIVNMTGDLKTRLAKVRDFKGSADDKDEIRGSVLKSFSIEEWDEAGEWFVSQFSDVVKRLQEARKKKRDLSKGYEKDVGERHAKVAQQTKYIEDAMTEMRSQGQNLFPHTPQKRVGK